MKKVLTGLLAVAVVAAVAVGAMKMGDSPSERLRQTYSAHRGNERRGTVLISSGMMPEVVSTAEMPRLVMPTVEVRAFPAVAMSASEYNAN